MPRLELVKDIFLFQCFTGLSYVDVYDLKWKNVVKRSEHDYWLEVVRRKSGQITQIPLFPLALSVILKYNNNVDHQLSDLLLPCYKIQKTNSYLKEVADLCGIQKTLTTHCGRRTFASTVMLNNGVRIEAVSRMLAHTNIRTTQLYAKMFDQNLVDQTKHITWLWDSPKNQH